MEEKQKILRGMWKEAEQELEELRKKVEPLMVKMRKAQEKISLINRLIEVEKIEIGKGKSIDAIEGVIVSGEDARKLFIEILKSYPKGMHYKDIYRKLEDRGFRMRGKYPTINLIAHMSNDTENRFESLGKGVWKLNENLVED